MFYILWVWVWLWNEVSHFSFVSSGISCMNCTFFLYVIWHDPLLRQVEFCWTFVCGANEINFAKQVQSNNEISRIQRILLEMSVKLKDWFLIKICNLKLLIFNWYVWMAYIFRVIYKVFDYYLILSNNEKLLSLHIGSGPHNRLTFKDKNSLTWGKLVWHNNGTPPTFTASKAWISNILYQTFI